MSAHDETRECIFAAFRMPIVDMHAFGETVVLGRFIIRFSNIDAAIAKECRRRKAVLSFYSFQHFLHFLHSLTQKRIKNVIPRTTPLRTRTSLRSLDKLGASSVVVPFLRGRFSLLSSRALFDGLLCFFFLYLSLKGEELFYSDDYSRAKSARDDAARSASFFEC